MDIKSLISYVKNEFLRNRNSNISYYIDGLQYNISILCPNKDKNINIPSVIIVPQTKKINNSIIVESNNFETDDLEVIIRQAVETGIRLAELTKETPSPIVIPLIPSKGNEPYYQQLSKECFEIQTSNPYYRIDEQIVRIIEQARFILKTQFDVTCEEKIFLNGYSTSGVFAQRFALLHPELIETACIGGASGSIPIPSKNIGYPIGIEDYQELFGKPFDMDSYESIKFRYYVGELETINKTSKRFDEDGLPSPMHDMSYFDRSVPEEVGIKQRNTLGRDMFERAKKTIEILRKCGINITHTVIPRRTHNNCSGQGVNELGDKFISNTYREIYLEGTEI